MRMYRVLWIHTKNLLRIAMRKFVRYAFSSPPLIWGPSSFALEAPIVTAFPLNETKKTYFREFSSWFTYSRRILLGFAFDNIIDKTTPLLQALSTS
jgi:hypothetical protein